ncbi:Secreted RxLR effector peptide protein [Phytophthora palmivora]|uniref:Secreted RxLR effector peptide protein n=1 Tax=Phytophthora palmivora TaxID=4796 RepID=A0A2P4X8H1_9STRA|nr:Secreted RxLR effector peptide protein [Phytophthora palmivora]
MRLLRYNNLSDEIDEERTFSLQSIPVLKKLTNVFKSKITPGTLLNWANKEKSPDFVFRKLNLNKAGDKLFDNPDVNVWAAYTNVISKANPEEAMVTTLKTRYTDEALSQMILAAKKVSSTESVAIKIQTGQVQNWLTRKKSPNDVFEYLLLNKAGDDLLSNPELAIWIRYMTAFNKENPMQKTSLHATLKTHYSSDAISKMIEAGKVVKGAGTIGVAKRLEATQIQTWLGSKSTPDDVFQLLKLDEVGDDLLASPQLNTFTNYMNVFNKENPDKQTSLIAAMTTSYDDGGVVKILEAAKKIPSTEKIAMNLEAAQFHHWLSTDKGPDKVFKALGLDKAGENLLSSPQFTKFTKYTDDFHAKHLDKKMTTMWTIRASYSDFDVAKMIIAGEKVPGTQKAAQRMEAELFKSWMQPPNNPDDAFRSLKLNTAGDKLFSNPMFRYWMKFLDEYNKVMPGRNNFHTGLTVAYEDEALVKLINTAKENPNTKTLADKLETEMLTQFIYAEKQPIDVAKLLNVKKKTDPNWKLWKKYMQDYHKYHLRDITT